MVRASWAIGEDTGFVGPSWSILVGSWFLIASSCGWSKLMSNKITTSTLTSDANYTQLQLRKTCFRTFRSPATLSLLKMLNKGITHAASMLLSISSHTRCQITQGTGWSWRQLFSTHVASDKVEDMKSWSVFFNLVPASPWTGRWNDLTSVTVLTFY